MSSGRLQAKDIEVDDFVTAILQATAEPHATATFWDIAECLSSIVGFEVPEAVVLAKAKRLIAAKKIDGCACGCRGDFEVLDDGSGEC